MNNMVAGVVHVNVGDVRLLLNVSGEKREVLHIELINGIPQVRSQDSDQQFRPFVDLFEHFFLHRFRADGG